MVRWLTILALSALIGARAELSDPVTAWNNALLESIRTENSHPCVSSRALAIVHGAMFDASANIAGAKAFYSHETAPVDANLAVALNSAAYTTSTNLYPSRTGIFRDLYRKILAETPPSDARARSIRFGSAVADAWIAWRATDGSSGTRIYVPKAEPGAWRRTPPFNRPPEMQNWAKVKTFVLENGSQFRPPGPPELESKEYAEELQLVARIGGAESLERSAEETEIAKFWSDFSYTVTPPGHWNQIAQEVARVKKFSLTERVRMFAMLNMTLSDVAIACWDSKYAFNYWRPVTAIREADKDQNDETAPVKDWMPLLNTPAFPEYVSGHSAFSAAGAVVLSKFNGGDAIDFSVPSDSLPGKWRSYQSLWKCAEEVSRSRLYGGIHFPSALEDGLAMGRQIAEHVLAGEFVSQESGGPRMTAR